MRATTSSEKIGLQPKSINDSRPIARPEPSRGNFAWALGLSAPLPCRHAVKVFLLIRFVARNEPHDLSGPGTLTFLDSRRASFGRAASFELNQRDTHHAAGSSVDKPIRRGPRRLSRFSLQRWRLRWRPRQEELQNTQPMTTRMPMREQDRTITLMPPR